jgi:hypothetical protein
MEETDKKKKGQVSNRKQARWVVSAIWVAAVVLLVGNYRVYTGIPGQALVFKAKFEFSFKDTFVNVADLEGMPRIAVAIQHPEVKRHLEKMGIFKSDEEVAAEKIKIIKRRGG